MTRKRALVLINKTAGMGRVGNDTFDIVKKLAENGYEPLVYPIIPGTELFGLLEALNDVSGTLSGYLLDEQNLVLTGEQIFYDLSSGKYFFTYYPGEVVEPDVFRFLADGIDGTDKRAAAAAYRLCASVGADRQALREVIRKEVSQRDTPKPWEIETEEPAEDCTAKSESPDFDSSGHHTLRTAAKPERNCPARRISLEAWC